MCDAYLGLGGHGKHRPGLDVVDESLCLTEPCGPAPKHDRPRA